MTEAVRTPDDRFAKLPGYAFAPNYCNDLKGYEGLRLHYLDEGARGARETFLCLHGQPTWSYLYRKLIPAVTTAGHRAVAPDYFGFGRSDKPVEDALYTFDFHRNALIDLVERLDLKNITLVCQDWGGLLGLTLPMDMPERFSKLLVMNTMFATGDRPLSEGFIAWRAWSAANPDMAVGKLMARACPLLAPAGEVRQPMTLLIPICAPRLVCAASRNLCRTVLTPMARRYHAVRETVAGGMVGQELHGDRHDRSGAGAARHAWAGAAHPQLPATDRGRRGRAFRAGMGAAVHAAGVAGPGLRWRSESS